MLADSLAQMNSTAVGAICRRCRRPSECPTRGPARDTAGARARGKKGGRKPAMDAKKLALARTLRADPTLPIGDICKTLGVSKATFYRYTTCR